MMHATYADPSSYAQQAFLWACTLDVMVAKPGNVSIHSAGHGMTADLFLASARASAPAIAHADSGVGSRIEAAVRRTRAVAQCNTNLGILLLCAPLAAALEHAPQQLTTAALRHALAHVLDRLDVADAEAAYRAIAHASPGGLGDAPEQDVADPPTVDLRSAMRMAAMRDTIARQYANGFADLFEVGLPRFQAHVDHYTGEPPDLARAMQSTYLGFLARFPDSHIVRKHGFEIAQSVTEQARALKNRCNDGNDIDPGALAEWDQSLKSQGINPGTSADLTVATAMIAGMLAPSLCANRLES